MGLAAEFSVILQLFYVAVGFWDIWEQGRAEPEFWQKAEGAQGSMRLSASYPLWSCLLGLCGWAHHGITDLGMGMCLFGMY